MNTQELIAELNRIAGFYKSAQFSDHLTEVMQEAANELERVAWISDIANGVFGGKADELTVEEYRERQLAKKWISVDDKLPERGKDVLLYFRRTNKMGVGGLVKRQFDAKGDIWYLTPSQEFIFGASETPTHWQPLPQEPKEEN